MPDDSPTAEQIGAEHRANLIRELAHRLYPEDGYESDDENQGAELFSLLVEATYIYSTTAYDAPNRGPSAVNVETTLMAIGENLTETVPV